MTVESLGLTDQGRCQELVDKLCGREITDPQDRILSRIELYWLQVRLNRRSLEEATGKIAHLLNRVEQKHPEVYHFLTTPDDTQTTPLARLRSRIIIVKKNLGR